VHRLPVKRVSLDFQVYNRSFNMIDKKVRNASSYHLFFFFLGALPISLHRFFDCINAHAHTGNLLL
jgi:hypothetical protein